MTERIPFDLEAAKNGAAIVTRDGRKAEFSCMDETLESPYTFWANIDGRGHRSTFCANGSWLPDIESDDDLFMVEAPKQDATNKADLTQDFRDALIFEMVRYVLPKRDVSADEMMDAVDTIMKRRALVPMAQP